MSKQRKNIGVLMEETLVPQEDQPYEIPANWVWVKSGSILNFVGGGTPSKGNNDYWNGNIPWATVKDIKKEYLSSTIDHITNQGLENTSATLAQPNELLLVTRMSPGKSTITEMPTAINQDLKIVRPKLEIPSYFLKLYFKLNKPMIESMSTGSTVKGIQVKKLKELAFPLPPLAEQKRIAEKVENLFTKIDKAKQLIEEAEKSFELRRLAILDKAFRGELTKKWRERQQRNDVLDYIEYLKKKNQYKGTEEQKELFELPQGWRWARIGELFHVQVGTTPSRKNEKYWEGKSPWLSSGEVQFNVINESREYVTDLAIKEKRLKLAPKNSVLFGMIGEGKTRGQVSLLNIDAYHNQNVASIWVSDTDINSLYVYYWLELQYDYNRQNSSGNNQPAYNKSRVQEIVIPIAPLKEIEEIVSTIKKIFLLEEEAKKMYSLEETLEEIRASVLSEAFKGNLGTNDINELSVGEMST